MSKDLSELHSNKVIRTRHLLSDITEECFKVLELVDGKIEFISVDVYASFFLRFTYCLEATQTLLKDFEKDKYFREHSIAIVLRASLLDYLTMLYLETYYIEIKTPKNNTEPNYHSELLKLLTSQIRRTINLTKADKASENYDHESYKKYVDTVRRKFPYLFDKNKEVDYNKPSKSLKYGAKEHEISNGKIRNRLDLVAKNSDINYEQVFALYNVYSKYDHFGLISMTLRNIDSDEAFGNIMESLFYIFDGLAKSMSIIHNEYDLGIHYKNIVNHIRVLRGVFFTKTLELSDEYKQKY